MLLELVLALLFILGGAALVINAAWTLESARGSRRWPRASGTVVASYVEHTYDAEGNDLFRPAIAVRYVVDGEEYVCKRIRFGTDSGGSEPATRQTARSYRGGGTVGVYYNPENRSEAVLETGLHWRIFAMAAIGMALVWFGARALP